MSLRCKMCRVNSDRFVRDFVVRFITRRNYIHSFYLDLEEQKNYELERAG